MFYTNKEIKKTNQVNIDLFYIKLNKDSFIDLNFIEVNNNLLLQNFIHYVKQNKKTITFNKSGMIFYVYIYMCIHSYITYFGLIENEKLFNYNTVIINNTKNQLFISILKNNNFFKSFSIGYILMYLDLIKKSLKKQTSSYILLLKIILKMIENFFIKDLFLFNIVGTKKNFFKWLNFLKLKTVNLKTLIYIYTPSIFQTPIKIKKIKSIKKRLKKKYLYNETMI